jgi:Animal haem peroxidase
LSTEGKKSAPLESRNWRPQRDWRPSLGGRFQIRFFSILNKLVPWHRLPWFLGGFNLEALQLELREKNLFYPTLDGRLKALAPEPQPPDSRAFRKADGRFNDLDYPLMGAAETRFGRNFAPEDTQREPKERLLQPSPRVVSERLLARTQFEEAKTLNLLAAAWIQFQVHDWFDHSDNELDEPFEIPLEPGDNWDSCPMKIKRTRCDDTRTDLEDRAGLPPTCINMASHWWDASAIYGSKQEITDSLRSDEGGKLQMQNRRLPLGQKTQIPSTGFSSNWWIGLEILHTLFALEHNAICDRLRLEFPQWENEQLFQTARLVNAALIAKIHITEWTPALLGHKTLQFAMRANWWGIAGERLTKIFGRFGSGAVVSGIPGSKHDHAGVPFSLTEEFVSVYRMHSLLPDSINFRHLADGKFVKSLKMEEVLREKAHAIISEDLTACDVLYSMGIAHPGALTLHNFPNFLRKLTLPPDKAGATEVVDLGAIDILRDRERGVPRYNQFRRLLRMKPYNSFEELTEREDWVRALREVYNNDIERVDLLVGTLAEAPLEGFGISETAFRIFLLMAPRRLKSDRFFTDDYSPRIYSRIGLDWISNNDMTSVLLRHYPELKPTLWRIENPFNPWHVIDQTG